MLLKFTKMHGLGNDFVVIDAISQDITITPQIAKKLGDRHFGVGCDQILVVEPPRQPNTDFRYRIFNNDGTEVEQCGNGARCFAKFVHNRKLTGKNNILVETANGIIELKLQSDQMVKVNMGLPLLNPKDIPFMAEQQKILYGISVENLKLSISAVSIGNPHAVLEVDDVCSASVQSLGQAIGSHRLFPKQANVGFMQIVNSHEINLRVYERGVGETLACGSGACAAVVAGQLQGLLESSVTVNLTGGSLTIEWLGDGHPVIMTGPATSVYHGQINV
jgi:diaminopimelate epimerase|tara:strand:+ start:947 stop:1777 length:831 start_codon:yes stop_codon:yes gene_type:complete